MQLPPVPKGHFVQQTGLSRCSGVTFSDLCFTIDETIIEANAGRRATHLAKC